MIKKIDLFDNTYKVIYTSGTKHNSIGSIIPSKKEIYISKHLSKRMQQKVLIHELCHLFVNLYHPIYVNEEAIVVQLQNFISTILPQIKGGKKR